jgi:hypothetical protein
LGQKLSSKEQELYKRVDEVLHYIWDPIEVSGEPYARDEYYSYLPKVFSMLLQNINESEIIDYLIDVQTNWMTIKASREKVKEVVSILIKWKEKIFKEP